MSEFSDYLNDIRNNRNISAAEAAQISEFDVTTVFRWMKGERIPETPEVLVKLAECLRLNSKEYNNLKLLYGRSVYGKRCFDDYLQIGRMISNSRNIGCNNVTGKIVTENDMYNLPEKSFKELKGKSEVISFVRIFLMNLSKFGSHLYIKSHVSHEEINSLINAYSHLYAPMNIEEIIIPEYGGLSDDLQNIRILQGIVNMMTLNRGYDIWMCENNLETDICNRNWLLSEGALLKFNDDMSEGIITTCVEWIDEAKEFQGRLRGYAYNMLTDDSDDSDECLSGKLYFDIERGIDILDDECNVYGVYISSDDNVAFLGVKTSENKRYILEIRNKAMNSSICNFIDVFEKNGEKCIEGKIPCHYFVKGRQ